MKACSVLCGVSQENVPDKVGRRQELIILSEILPEYQEKNKLLYYILASSCTGRAQCFVRTAEAQNGLEAWRLLNKRYHRQNADNTFELLRVLMNFSCGNDVRSVENKHAEFDSLVHEYDERATDILSDEVIRGILMRVVPEPLKSHVRVCSSSFTSSRNVRRAIAEFVKAEIRKNFKDMFKSDPMEVDVLVPWQAAEGKGKSKGKAKGKGKGEK
jgi:hypothetical protein